MTTYTGAVFNNGIVAGLIDILASARERGEAAPFTDEIARVNRTLDSCAAARWAMPSATVAALLDLVAEDLRTSPGRDLPPGFLQRLDRAAGDRERTVFLTDMALSLRTSQRAGIPRFEDLPLSAWEAELRYAHLRDFSWWVESDEHETFEEGVLAGVTSEHPGGCAHALPPLIAELHAALLLDADAPSAAGLRSVVPWATPPILREVLRLASVHLLDAH
ncbi:hypothetical protein [Streptomyces sp. NL15-2K]|uniref:hypothetical protein n=1 Tax=Streptomyces sp. NL15-2K TaxID=376149 RepID=UPI000F55E694|nr:MULTISPECIES: hypothetical protein [Actinomycetes]WKX09768.1 hypothetical protein Q4V64_20645 [Kutzneria buriramensis]GCB48695.1 hypothetical protein SNL152K_6022 [Streptomyces sp. NL15-2K]